MFHCLPITSKHRRKILFAAYYWWIKLLRTALNRGVGRESLIRECFIVHDSVYNDLRSCRPVFLPVRTPPSLWAPHPTPLPFPFSPPHAYFPSPPVTSLPLPSPSLLPLEVGPLNPPRGVSKLNLVHFNLKIWHLVATILMIFFWKSTEQITASCSKKQWNIMQSARNNQLPERGTP